MSGVKLDIAIWNYDRAAAREPLDAYLRYHFEQGLSSRSLTIEDVFVPELMDT
jgi:hypothetical protein